MDILFLAIVAIYIFMKLKSQLGNVDEEEKKSIRAKLDSRMQEIQKEVVRQAKEVINQANSENILTKNQLTSGLDISSKKALDEILQKSNITLDFFVEGAKSAFEMILTAFAKGDLETLKSLLSPEIFNSFQSAIKEREVNKQKLTTNLISIKNVEISQVSLNENLAIIKLNIFSKQINYVCNENNEVISGVKDQINEMSDSWTFSRDINSVNPNWQIIAT